MAACARWERESLVQDRKVEALQAEVNRLIQDNAKLIRVADQERKEKLELLQREQDWTNHRNLEGAETHKYESLNRVLTIENEALRQEVERSKLEKTALVKEKQNAVNKLVVAESKLEALQMEDQYLKASFAEVAAENERLREENAGLSHSLGIAAESETSCTCGGIQPSRRGCRTTGDRSSPTPKRSWPSCSSPTAARSSV